MKSNLAGYKQSKRCLSIKNISFDPSEQQAQSGRQSNLLLTSTKELARDDKVCGSLG